jgi:DNA ligase-1
MANDEFISNLASLQAICNVSEERANELLEASNGSMERAVEIFFHQKCTEDKKSPRKVPTNKKRPTPQKPTCKDSNNTRTKQAKLHSFFHRNQSITPKKIASVSQPELISIDDSPEQAKRVSNVAKHPNVLKLPQTTDKKRSIEQKSLQSSIQFKAEVSFERLSSTLQEMADTTKRTIKLDVLKSFILDFVFHAGEMEKAFGLTCALYLVLGKSANEPLDVSHGACSKAIQSMFGVKRSQLSSANRQHGDLGDSAASFFLQKKFFGNPVGLSVIQVYSLLQKIVDADGRDAKQHILLKLMRSCQTKSELRFLVRLIIGNMRVGANLKTVLAALAMAICSIREEETMDTKSAIDLVQTTHDVCPDLEKIIRALLEGGFKQLEKDCDIQVLTPIAPMLAHPTHSLEQVEKAMLEKKSSVALEWKYDGVRCQAHYNGSTSKLFSRHMLESTAQYPDAIEAILGARKRGKAIHSFILDAEIVGVETEGNQTRLLPFQDLSKRKKKNDGGEGVSVRVFVFDLMFLNGQSCVNRPLWERRELLRDHFEETSDFAFVKSQILSTYDEDVIKAFLEEAVQRGTEGLMVKILGKHIDVSSPLPNEISTYEAGTRSHSWLKVKRDYVAGYADTIDVVPIGAW